MNTRTRIAAALAAVALLAACSSTPETEPTPTAAPRSAATTEAPSPTPAAPSESPNMPDVVGMPAAEARELLVAERLKVEFFDAATGEKITEASFDSSTVQVASQEPLAGAPKVDSRLAWLTVDIGTTMPATPEPTAVPMQAPTAPSYEVALEGDIYRVTVDQIVTQSEATAIIVELRAAQQLEGGYFVQINCSTGGTESADNRLANGKFAIGTRGAALTGLAPGGMEATVNEGRTCP